jgi:hypothetical protein
MDRRSFLATLSSFAALDAFPARAANSTGEAGDDALARSVWHWRGKPRTRSPGKAVNAAAISSCPPTYWIRNQPPVVYEINGPVWVIDPLGWGCDMKNRPGGISLGTLDSSLDGCGRFGNRLVCGLRGRGESGRDTQ